MSEITSKESGMHLIEKFSKISKQEIRSNVFEVGGHQWSILVYPKGCEVPTHLSLFLCVANCDRILPDTLHEFWKTEHDWGWKKYMELLKLHDGFIDEYGSLTIMAQVQEWILMIFWCSLCAFWLGMDQKSRREMSREKMVVILKLVVKHFFIKKEVTSSLVMEFLFHGLNSLVWSTNKEKILQTDSRQMVKLDLDSSILKALEEEPKKERATDVKNLTAPIVSVDKDMFVLVNNDGGREDEKLLTEFARRTLEVFILDHILCTRVV
ncbi:hypothetical protein N665_0019s0061 [Sinapis alba]|nr:hypothetical protein N665_0019s0061 [Sinapis alba]